MSSLLPPPFIFSAKSRGFMVEPNARGFMYNAGIESVVDFFDIGTRPSIQTTDR
jgi:hypothetical protein